MTTNMGFLSSFLYDIQDMNTVSRGDWLNSGSCREFLDEKFDAAMEDPDFREERLVEYGAYYSAMAIFMASKYSPKTRTEILGPNRLLDMIL